MGKKTPWKRIVLCGLIILVLVLLPFPVKGLTRTVDFDFREQQEPTAYIGNAAIQSGLTSTVTPDRFARLRFYIDDSDLFTVNETTGALSTKSTIDRETVCPNLRECKLTFEITVLEQVSSENFELFTILKCVLRITDINDHAPTFDPNSVVLKISEGNKPGEVLRTSAATDKDTTAENSIQQYRFKESSDLFSLRVIKNPDGSTYLGIEVKQELNREERDFYQVTVVATDGGFPVRSGSVLINITVTDVNDNTPKFDKNSYNDSVPENFDLHVPIMKVHAEDKDTGSSAEISYQFSSQVSNVVKDTLYIDQQTGEILAYAKIDYETVKFFQFFVEAVDHGEPPERSRVEVTLHVLDENDNAPQININPSPTGTRISELEPVGKFIAHVSVLDKDDGINAVVHCAMEDKHFALEKFEEYASNMYKVILENPLNHEDEESHRITITCTDSGRPPMSNSTSFTVEVIDENDNRPIFTETIYYGEVLENVPGLLDVVEVKAHDWDSGAFGTVRYAIDDKYNGLFNIDPNTGMIRVNGPLDRENEERYEFHVVAMDGSPEALRASSLVVVTVKDENDEPPRFPRPFYFGGILENQPIGTIVGNVTGVDRDDPATTKFRYSIVMDGSEDARSFSIDPISGVIKSKTVFDREQKSQYHIIVRVSDPAKPSFTSTCNYTVRIRDDNDHAPEIYRFQNENATFTIQYSLGVGKTITTIVAYDADAATSPNSKVIFLIQSGDLDQLFNLNRYMGKLSLARRIEAKDPRQYHLVIRVEDEGSPPLFDTKDLYVSINGTAPPSSAGSGLNQNILIVIILIGTTVVLGLAILATICLIKKIDRERRANRAAQKKLEDKMYHMKQDEVFNHIPIENTEEPDCTSNNLNKRAKKEVSFSFDEESDSHNTSSGSGHPLTSFRVGGDRSKTNGQGYGVSRPGHPAPGSGMNILVVGHGDRMGHVMRSPEEEECHLIEILKKSAEDALSESSGETDPSDSGRGGSEDDSSHRGSGLDPERTVNGLYPKVQHRGCHDNEAYHPQYQHHINHLHPPMAPNRYASLGKGKTPRHQQQVVISPRHSLSSDIESDMSLTGSRSSQSRTDSERSTNPILPHSQMSSGMDSPSPRGNYNNNNNNTNNSNAYSSNRSRDSSNNRRSLILQDSPHRLTSPYHHTNSLARSSQGQGGHLGTFNNNNNNSSNSIPINSMSMERLSYGGGSSTSGDRSRSTTPSERSSSHYHRGHGHGHGHQMPHGYAEEDDRTTTSGSYTINPDELRQEIDQLILHDSIV